MPAELDPVELSRELLAEARSATEPEQCARLDSLAAQLHHVSPSEIDGDHARTAFWVNLYNGLILHCLCRWPVRGSLLFHLRLFDRTAYVIGGLDYPLNLIEHGILRGNRRAPLRARRPLRRSDLRLASAPSRSDPRIHFALNCGARSCPPIRDYDPGSLDEQLEIATRAYLAQETAIDAERARVRLPRLMRIYSADFGGLSEKLRFAAARLPELDRLLAGGDRPRVIYTRFDWRVAPRP
jgi:hypothetical protein